MQYKTKICKCCGASYVPLSPEQEKYTFCDVCIHLFPEDYIKNGMKGGIKDNVKTRRHI